MKYVALLSGGKDSCYNLVHCARNGHELVAAASLGPEPGKEELDSYMYQTVGQDAIDFVARALEVPLYRQVIIGNAVEQGSEYGGRDANNSGGIQGDETEDLYTLLSTVKVHYPDIQGVSVGAILSNYQRVRVEHVCRRLGLIPLCYLWQRNQGELLSEMIEGGIEAILIKVAGIGLSKSHLGQTLSQMQPTLVKLNSLYGAHICGEGGEYESLTLDCPLFRCRIILTETETVIHSDSDFATVAFLRVNGAQLEAKLSVEQFTTVPPLLDIKHEAIREAVLESQQLTALPPMLEERRLKFDYQHPIISSESHQNGVWTTISNVQVPCLRDDSLVEDEVTQCFEILAERLAEHQLRLSNCVNINLCISSMDLFLRVNAVYGTFFGVSPPARACVGVDLPPGVRVRLECIAFAEEMPGDRQALHVQSLSYWAPANIGPYSQAIVVGERVFVSGQIGLVPSQLALPNPTSLATEVALSSQHVSRVVSAIREAPGGGWEGHIQLNIFWCTNPSDVHHIQKGQLSVEATSPTLIITIKELPKNALVEKQVFLHTGRHKVRDEDFCETFEICVPSFQQEELQFDDGNTLRWESSVISEDQSSCVVIFLKGDFFEHSSRLRTLFSKKLESVLSARYFYRPGIPDSLAFLSNYILGGNSPPITPIPCRRISSINGEDWDFAFCIISLTN